jgi:hypothetical protein
MVGHNDLIRYLFVCELENYNILPFQQQNKIIKELRQEITLLDVIYEIQLKHACV